MVSDLPSTSEKSRAEKIIEQINANNAKKVAFILVLGFVCYHEIFHLRYGKFGTSLKKFLLISEF